MTKSAYIDNRLVDQDTDFAWVVERILLHGMGGGLRTDHHPADVLFRAYQEADAAFLKEALALGVSASLTHPNDLVRYSALLFYDRWPEAAGAARVLEVVEGTRKGFKGVKHNGHSLEAMLIRALGRVATAGNAEALDLAKRCALQPGGAPDLMASLTTIDPDWVCEHIENIVRSCQESATTVLYNLEFSLERSASEIIDVAVRIAPLITESEVWSQLPNWVKYDEVIAAMTKLRPKGSYSSEDEDG